MHYMQDCPAYNIMGYTQESNLTHHKPDLTITETIVHSLIWTTNQTNIYPHKSQLCFQIYNNFYWLAIELHCPADSQNRQIVQDGPAYNQCKLFRQCSNLRVFELHLGKCLLVDVHRQFLTERDHTHRSFNEHCAQDRRDHRRRRRRQQLRRLWRRGWCSLLLTTVLTGQLPPTSHLGTKLGNQVCRQHLNRYLQHA